ncbi:alpha/beta hydrolase [Legionella fairfieldensis]|uniref:alpha/beta hydrolase n=1 Tax=Legionella fairfieldensis TaxID=45064 RepID=UPI00049001F9|nr:alpha/beta hydrolase [Legionella fairfieldensis]
MKKILVLAPVMPQQSDLESLANTLSFLQEGNQIDFIDPLSITEKFSQAAYYEFWQNELKKKILHYDALFGFSFGGIILQQCFPGFAGIRKPIILFSTPTFADRTLEEKLGKVIRLSREKRIDEALYALYSPVFYPNHPPQEVLTTHNKKSAARRLIFGLQRVLHTDSRTILQETEVTHLHLIGEHSQLVNRTNVNAPKTGRLVEVPGAGMRVLQNNPAYCHKLIMEWLNDAV